MEPMTKAGIAAWESIFRWYLDHGPGPVTVAQIAAIEAEAAGAERTRFAALVAAAAAVAEDYHDMAIVVDEDRSVSGALHPAVPWGLCPDPKCAALREALSAGQ